jgi:hypothetical protein
MVASLGAYLQAQIVVWLFVLVAGSLFVWILRLHFDSRFENFDLTKMIEQADGSPDGEKIRMWASYLAGLFAFFYLLHRDPAAFNAYAPLFLGIAFAHLVANRMTARRPEDAEH